MRKEECSHCNNFTGKAGVGDDSLYTDDGLGPFCEVVRNAYELGSKIAASIQPRTDPPEAP